VSQLHQISRPEKGLVDWHPGYPGHRGQQWTRGLSSGRISFELICGTQVPHINPLPSKEHYVNVNSCPVLVWFFGTA